jgi:hypothetical protein
MSRTFLLTIVLSGSALLSGCVSLGGQRDDEPQDIAWLIRSLQDEGVFILERPQSNLTPPASTSVRLILDGRESLDVYLFDETEMASSQAYQFANRLPGNDVYLQEHLVVVRKSTRDTGLNGTLLKLLGSTL